VCDRGGGGWGWGGGGVGLTVCDLDTSKRGGVGGIWAIAPQKKKTS